MPNNLGNNLDLPISLDSQVLDSTYHYIGEFFQGGFLGMKVVTFFATLRADLEDFFKCRR